MFREVTKQKVAQKPTFYGFTNLLL